MGRGRLTVRWPAKAHRRPLRRLHPAWLQRWFLEIPEEDRVEEYSRRWRAFETACKASDEALARAVDALARAEARLLGLHPPTLTFAEGAERALALAERFVARYWRGRPCPELRGRRLPRIATGSYFGIPTDAIHWLDLDPELVAEGLAHELADFKRRMFVRAHDGALSPILLDDVRDRLSADPIGSVSTDLVRRVRERLTVLAHSPAGLPETRQCAATWLERLDRAIRPDFRARQHRGPWRLTSFRRRALLELVAAVREDQATFRVWCAERDPTSLPPALRGESCTPSERIVRSTGRTCGSEPGGDSSS